jgi:hypothetical protein
MTDHPRPNESDGPNYEELNRDLQRAADVLQVQRLETLVCDHPGIADAQSNLDVAFGPALWSDDLREDDPRTGDAAD